MTSPSVTTTTAFVDGSLPFRSSKVVTQCVVQLELISTVALLAESHLSALTTASITKLVHVLQASAAFAQAFNANMYGKSSYLTPKCRCLELTSMACLPLQAAPGGAVGCRVHALPPANQAPFAASSRLWCHTTAHGITV